MLKAITFVAIAALAAAVTTTPQPAFAHDDGAVAAGVIGGLAVGAIVGSQIDRNGDYYDHDRGYRNHDRHHRRHYSDCRTERREVTDRYGNEHFRRGRVCN
jgi:hypothetical protein